MAIDRNERLQLRTSSIADRDRGGELLAAADSVRRLPQRRTSTLSQSSRQRDSRTDGRTAHTTRAGQRVHLGSDDDLQPSPLGQDARTAGGRAWRSQRRRSLFPPIFVLLSPRVVAHLPPRSVTSLRLLERGPARRHSSARPLTTPPSPPALHSSGPRCRRWCLSCLRCAKQCPSSKVPRSSRLTLHRTAPHTCSR